MGNTVGFITGLEFEDIPEKPRQMARLCLLDAVGCMISGFGYPPVLELARTLSRQHPGGAAMASTSFTAARPWAAFSNTHAATFFDMDDGHRKAQGHPGGVIIPVSLMLAAETGCSGKALLTAIVAGYETAVRSALIMRRLGGPRKGSGAWSITGGVAAGARLLYGSRAVLKNALGLAEYYAPQAPQDRSLAAPSSMKEGMAWAAHAAITAIDLAGAGFDAMDPFLLDAAECDDLGSAWEISSVYFKMYACCRFSHPVLDGLSDLMATHDIKIQDIDRIRVHSFAKALLLGRRAPDTPVAAMYSIPWAIGTRLVTGAVDPQAMTGKALSDPRILELARRVSLEEAPEMSAAFPEKCLARVTLVLKNGAAFESRTLSAKGDPDTPYTTGELEKKFFRLSRRLPGAACTEIHDRIMNIETDSPAKIWDLLVNGTCR